MSYFTEDLLKSIRSRSLAPTSQNTYNDDKLVALANEELQSKIVKDLMKVREDFFLDKESIPLKENKSYYPIPSRSIGGSLKQVFYVDNNGVPHPLEKVELERITEFNSKGTPQKFYIESDEIVVLPKPQNTEGSLLVYFPANPNSIVLSSKCASINSLSDNGITLSFIVNTDLTGSISVGNKIDIISKEAPFKTWVRAAVVTQITSNQIDIDLTNALNEINEVEIQIGDQICPNGFSNIPQIPVIFHPVLAQSVVKKILEALGHITKKQSAEADLNELRAGAIEMIKNRVENSPKRINQKTRLVNFLR